MYNLHLNIDINKVHGIWSLSCLQGDHVKFFLFSNHCAQNRPDQELCWSWISMLCPLLGPGTIPHIQSLHHEVETIASLVEAFQKRCSDTVRGYHDVWHRVSPEQIVYRIVIALWAYNYIERTTIKKKESSMKYLVVRSERQGVESPCVLSAWNFLIILHLSDGFNCILMERQHGRVRSICAFLLLISNPCRGKQPASLTSLGKVMACNEQGGMEKMYLFKMQTARVY